MICISKNKIGNKYANLYEDDWNLSSQLFQFEEWLIQNASSLSDAKYIVDIGFVGDKEAGGGGYVLEPSFMRKLVDMNIELWFSEYPCVDEGDILIEDE